MTSPITRRYRIFGNVQGVWFRRDTSLEAQKIGIKGWVKNLSDGSVEVFASGTEDALLKLEAFLRSGSAKARVDQVRVEHLNEVNVFDSFSIQY